MSNIRDLKYDLDLALMDVEDSDQNSEDYNAAVDRLVSLVRDLLEG